VMRNEKAVHARAIAQLHMFFNDYNLTFRCQVFLLPSCKLF